MLMESVQNNQNQIQITANTNTNWDNNKILEKMVSLACGELDSEDVSIPWESIYHNFHIRISSDGVEYLTTQTKSLN